MASRRDADGITLPSDAPPAYHEVFGSSASSSVRPQNTGSSHLSPAAASSATTPSNVAGPSSATSPIPAAHRRSMEDEGRPLPKGWIRQFDPKTRHQFFVDTTTEPPRSIWVHPYDDTQYLSSLSSEERERIEQDSLGRGHPPSKADIIAAHSDTEDEHHYPAASPSLAGPSSSNTQSPPQQSHSQPPPSDGKKTFGRKMKDKLTGTTHEQREEMRRQRAIEERQMYEQHIRIRDAMTRAAQTGQPQHVGRDRDGRDVYIEPPYGSPGSHPGYGPGGGGGGYGYDPYRGGVYETPNARYIRPPNPYDRPYGAGFGGGYGLPLAVMGGGLLGGLLLTDMLF